MKYLLLPVLVLCMISEPLSGAIQQNGTDTIPEEVAPLLPLYEVIQGIEAQTGYRVLYRDALVAGKTIRFSLNGRRTGGWEEDFIEQLQSIGLDAYFDAERKQLVLFRARLRPVGESQNRTDVRPLTLEGYVMDDQTGERLPFATVTWEDTGIQTNLQGYFYIRMITRPDRPELNLRVSYIGYHSREITLNAGDINQIMELPIRLQPEYLTGKEIVVTGPVIYGAADTINQGLLSIRTFSPVGETNSIRMLQNLPSVGQGMALSDGAFVRGSNAGALQVLLDGSTIYNQSHLFGLVDSFHDDAIRTSSFYYDVAPARYQSPSGGTLDLVTRTGSLHDFRGHAGMSSSAVSGSLEGPLVPGQASWLISGRTSILDRVGWFQTGRMVAWGLDIDRETSLTDDTRTLEERIVTPGDHEVQFYDAHGKVFYEGRHNNRWMLSGYSGYNHTLQYADRLVRPGTGREENRFETQTFETINTWGNNAGNLGFFTFLTPGLLLNARGGISYYHTRFLKEDFSYQRPGQTGQNQILYIDELESQSELTHWYTSADFNYQTPARSIESVRFGTAVHGYRSAYLEHSLNRSQFFLKTTPVLVEAYAESEMQLDRGKEVDRDGMRRGGHTRFSRWGRPLDLQAGVRMQYFSDGNYIQVSPRVRTTFFPEAFVSFGFGYSRTWQYLYKLSFYNLTTSDIWITAAADQEPAETDQFSAGLYVRPWSRAMFQVEAYLKRQRNLRFHEINVQSVHRPFEERPWLFDNDGFARGIEFLFRYSPERWQFTQTYTLGVAELKNDRMNQGDWFYAYWDRRHQFNTMVSFYLFQSLNVDLNWLYASGVPDRLDLFRPAGSRLGDYSRVDLSLHFTAESGRHKWDFRAGVYNLLNRNNPWYRDWVLTMEERQQRNRFRPVQADVYDLGFQPSFSVRYYVEP
ncbi:MAG: TonB-dependent receptor [Balneolales bacterium]